jgi:hypothetical protein
VICFRGKLPQTPTIGFSQRKAAHLAVGRSVIAALVLVVVIALALVVLIVVVMVVVVVIVIVAATMAFAAAQVDDDRWSVVAAMAVAMLPITATVHLLHDAGGADPAHARLGRGRGCEGGSQYRAAEGE